MTKADKIIKQLQELREELAKHQAKCKHPENRVSKEYGGDTGNYDPTQDCYWTDFTCNLCRKKWRITKPAHR